MQNAGLDEESRLLEEISITCFADDITLTAESK